MPSQLQPPFDAVLYGLNCREGDFGACFFSAPTSGKTKIYAARPGGRVWEAGLDGKVDATHKLKDLLSIPPSPVLGCRCVHTVLGSERVLSEKLVPLGCITVVLSWKSLAKSQAFLQLMLCRGPLLQFR